MTRAQANSLRQAMLTASEALPDEVADAVAPLYPRWESDGHYVVGDRRRYEGIVYKCLQEHDAQEQWTPRDATSLWARAYIDLEEWVQPTGASDAYNTGDRVKHAGKKWISTVDANVWEPGVYGWDEII